MSDALFQGLILSLAQAEVPEDATPFETAAMASRAADRFLPQTKDSKVQSRMASGGETMFIVKHWPRHKTELCAERRWMKLANKKKRRKK